MAGRKQIEVNWENINEMLEAGCTGTEVAGHLGISAMTLYRACKRDNKVNFEVYSKQKKESGNTLLRQAQFNQALDGNTTMLVWLGKNRLNQADKQEINSTVDMKAQVIDVRFEMPDNGTAIGSTSPVPPDWALMVNS